jgi:hypothetical protein
MRRLVKARKMCTLGAVRSCQTGMIVELSDHETHLDLIASSGL